MAFASVFALLVLGSWLVSLQHVGEKHFCTAESRQVEACVTVYDPVCGWTGRGYRSFSNSCFACMDKSVVYWVEGEC